MFLSSFLARFFCNSVCRSVFMRMDACTLSNINDGDARRPSAFLSERQLLLCSCSLFIVCVFPSLSPLSPPGPFLPSAPQSSGIFSLFTLQLLIVNNNTSHAAARRARKSCIAPPLRALSQQTKSQRGIAPASTAVSHGPRTSKGVRAMPCPCSAAPPVISASVHFHPLTAASWFIFNF